MYERPSWWHPVPRDAWNLLQAGCADLVLADREFSLVEVKNEDREVE
jgi:hypothetical protein